MSEKLWHAKSFELRSSGSFSRSRGVKFLLRDPFTSLENLGFMPTTFLPGPSPHHICVRHKLFMAQLFNLFQANFQASTLPAMSWLRGLLRCPTCLEVASTCFRDTRSVIKKGFSLVLWSWCHRLFAKKSLTRSSSLQEGGSSGWSRIFAKNVVPERTLGPTYVATNSSCLQFLQLLMAIEVWRSEDFWDWLVCGSSSYASANTCQPGQRQLRACGLMMHILNQLRADIALCIWWQRCGKNLQVYTASFRCQKSRHGYRGCWYEW